MKILLFRFLYKMVHSMPAYFAHFFFMTVIALQWFIGQRFFTAAGTSDLHGFFSAFPFAFILYVPLQVSFGRIKKQWDFPFSSFKICIASSLSVFIFCLPAILLTAAVPLCVNFFGNIEWAQFSCGYLGIFLFTFCTISFTNFIFNFVERTAVAFVISSVFIFAANTIHSIPLYVRAGKFLSFFMKRISFAWNFDSFAKGQLDFKTSLYFILASCLFIFLSYFLAEKRKGNCTFEFRKTVKNFFITFILLCIAGNFIRIKADLTESKKFTVSAHSKKIISGISEPLEITYYLSSNLKNLYPQVRDVSDYLETYASASDKISFRIVNPSTASMQKKLSDYGINGQPVRMNSISSSTVSNVYSAVIVDYLGIRETIPFVLDSSSLEFDLAQKISSLIEEKKKLVQVVLANSLDAETDYSLIFPYLKSLGYIPFLSELPSSGSGDEKCFASFKDVPLILLGSEKLEKEDLDAVEKFIHNGGKAFIASQPYSIKIKDDWSYTQNDNQLYFERFLFTYGIYFKHTLTSDISNFTLTLTSDSGTDGSSKNERTEFINYSLWPVLRPQAFARNGMTLFWPAAFDIDDDVASIENFSTSPILFTSSASWQTEKFGEKFITSPFLTSPAPGKNEVRGPFPVAASVSKNGSEDDIRLILFGDQYALSTPMIAYSSSETMDLRSLQFLGDSILMLEGERELLELKNKASYNYGLFKISEAEKVFAAKKTFFICLVLPAIILFCAGFFFACRRRKFYR